MERQKVVSSNIESVGYDPDNEILEVEFKRGGVYQYQGVTADEHDDLVNAPSIGKQFHANIRNVKPFQKM